MNEQHRGNLIRILWKRALRYWRMFASLLRAALIEYERDRARYLAVAMIYYVLVSLVPFLLLLLSTLGLVLRFSATAAAAEREVLHRIETTFGPQLSATINGLLSTLQQESIVASLISLVGVLLTASVLFRHLRLSFRAIWSYEAPLISGSARVVVRTAILERVIAFSMVLGGGGLLVVALALIAATQRLNRLARFLALPSQTTGLLLGMLISWMLAAITFALLFKFLPPVPIRWRDVWLTALLCAAAWVVTSELLAYFGSFTGGSAYNALGGMLALLLWMNIASQTLFFGAELCKVIATHDWNR